VMPHYKEACDRDAEREESWNATPDEITEESKSAVSEMFRKQRDYGIVIFAALVCTLAAALPLHFPQLILIGQLSLALLCCLYIWLNESMRTRARKFEEI
jgi:hypothetical protein